MTVITSPLVTVDPQIHVEFRNQPDPGQGLKLTKLTKLISYCQKHISYGYFNPYRPILTWHSKFELNMMIPENFVFLH